MAAHRFSFLFRVLQILHISSNVLSCVREEKKKITCASLIIILVSLFFVSLSRCCFFFALSSNTRSWEDKGKRNEMIFWTTGARDSLWDVVVKWDDICFKHILPRLDLNDVKFLYGVNTETRALIKRSTRANDLKEKFKVKEMLSISTLEVAWENKSLWPIWWDETYFCWKVAQTNKLELLKWAREEKKCKWGDRTIDAAAYQGNLEMVKYCVANECPIYEYTCTCAAGGGHLEVLKYLHEEVKAPWDEKTASRAAFNGHLHILEYLVERKYDQFDEYACGLAAENGHLDCLKYLHETAKTPWDEYALEGAHENNQTECVQYLLDNDCPLPYGWRIDEDGTLRTS